ncbi:hypothetical protein J6590_048869 [Homalodisca vitripennis]|nr:hypothetical protein J6590_019024 [Homalodisca vitripennis]KAG8296794.1 hypothetical protein J6590_048869 [Homalodisca vitripennis]
MSPPTRPPFPSPSSSPSSWGPAPILLYGLLGFLGRTTPVVLLCPLPPPQSVALPSGFTPFTGRSLSLPADAHCWGYCYWTRRQTRGLQEEAVILDLYETLG